MRMMRISFQRTMARSPNQMSLRTCKGCCSIKAAEIELQQISRSRTRLSSGRSGRSGQAGRHVDDMQLPDCSGKQRHEQEADFQLRLLRNHEPGAPGCPIVPRWPQVRLLARLT